MTRLLHSSSLRYALSVWLATVLALFVAFLVQLEPAQWAAITVWIIFMQSPRLNYSKIIWWAFGTVTGALAAVVMIALFSQTPDLLLASLAIWLAVCAAASALVRSYRAYGGVLAGYTSAIVAMSAVENPLQVFHLAVTRVSCIFIGMASAIFVMGVLMRPPRHWRDTVHHLGEYLKLALRHAAHALDPKSGAAPAAWGHVVDRLSTLEHTLDVTTAETPESRLRAGQARSLTATLCCLLAKAQSIELHCSRHPAHSLPNETAELLSRTAAVLETFAREVGPQGAEAQSREAAQALAALRRETAQRYGSLGVESASAPVSERFVLDRLAEIQEEAEEAAHDWAGLFGPWTPRRPSCIAQHRDYYTAALHALRMLVAMGLASAIWFVTQWPSGAQLVLFIAVVCSLLSLQEHPPSLGFAFIKSTTFCAVMAYVNAFWLFQRAEGFAVLATALGLFLVPAAYAYRHPRLHGGAVVSMLIFYGLSMPANQMNYDISAFLNNGMALLCAVICGFFSFHAVPPLGPGARRTLLLRAVRRDVAAAALRGGYLSEQRWTARVFDRLRLLHRADSQLPESAANQARERDMLDGLQLGLRQIRLRDLLRAEGMNRAAAREIKAAFRSCRKWGGKPEKLSRSLLAASERLQGCEPADQPVPSCQRQAQAELREMAALLERAAPFSAS